MYLICILILVVIVLYCKIYSHTWDDRQSALRNEHACADYTCKPDNLASSRKDTDCNQRQYNPPQNTL